MAAAPVVYGPFWAALVATLGLGGLAAGRLHLERPRALVAVGLTMTAATVLLNTTANLLAVTVAQVLIVLLAVAMGIHVARVLHDSVPSAVRTGVASGVGAFTWIAFLPFAVVFGTVSRDSGVWSAGWMITGAAVAVAGVLIFLAYPFRGRATESAAASPTEVPGECIGGVPAAGRDDLDAHVPVGHAGGR